MHVPSQEQIIEIKDLLTRSIKKLIDIDAVLITDDNAFNDSILDRDLHEITINHRLAVYLEIESAVTSLAGYHFDLEYNRNEREKKEVETSDGRLTVRPDILVHTRTNKLVKYQNYLAIEAKKHDLEPKDTRNVLGLIKDPNYYYLFGFTISYLSRKNEIFGFLYYSDGVNIIEEELVVPRDKPLRVEISSKIE